MDRINDRINELEGYVKEENRNISQVSKDNFYRFISIIQSNPAISLAEVDEVEDDVYIKLKDDNGNSLSIRFKSNGEYHFVMFMDHKFECQGILRKTLLL